MLLLVVAQQSDIPAITSTCDKWQLARNELDRIIGGMFPPTLEPTNLSTKAKAAAIITALRVQCWSPGPTQVLISFLNQSATQRCNPPPPTSYPTPRTTDRPDKGRSSIALSNYQRIKAKKPTPPPPPGNPKKNKTKKKKPRKKQKKRSSSIRNSPGGGRGSTPITQYIHAKTKSRTETVKSKNQK